MKLYAFYIGDSVTFDKSRIYVLEVNKHEGSVYEVEVDQHRFLYGEDCFNREWKVVGEKNVLYFEVG